MKLQEVRSNRPATVAQTATEAVAGYKTKGGKYCVDSSFPRSHSDQASVERAKQTSLIHGGPASQLISLKASAANSLVPDTAEDFPAAKQYHLANIKPKMSIFYLQKQKRMLWSPQQPDKS